MAQSTEIPSFVSPDRASPRRPLGSRVLVALAFVLGATAAPWLGLSVDATETFASASSDDALARRRYVVRRIMEELVAPDEIGVEGPLERGEYALATYAMAAYAVAQIALDAPGTREESRSVLERIIAQLQTARIRRFDTVQWGEDPLDSLGADRGHAAYLGQLNLVLGAYRAIGGDGRHDLLHQEVTEAIARRMRARPHRHFETYPGETYTMDNVVAAASLVVADRVRGGDHAALVAEYVAYTRERLLDPSSGLVVFALDNLTGEPVGRARGSGAGWLGYFLPMVDGRFAQEQFQALRASLVERVGPFAGVREYQLDDPGAGFGDTDSGPVLGWGVSATGFAVAGARVHGDETLYSALLSSIELAGITVDDASERRYLSASLLGDAVILAMKTARPWWEPSASAAAE